MALRPLKEGRAAFHIPWEIDGSWKPPNTEPETRDLWLICRLLTDPEHQHNLKFLSSSLQTTLSATKALKSITYQVLVPIFYEFKNVTEIISGSMDESFLKQGFGRMDGILWTYRDDDIEWLITPPINLFITFQFSTEGPYFGRKVLLELALTFPYGSAFKLSTLRSCRWTTFFEMYAAAPRKPLILAVVDKKDYNIEEDPSSLAKGQYENSDKTEDQTDDEEAELLRSDCRRTLIRWPRQCTGFAKKHRCLNAASGMKRKCRN